MSYLTTGLSLPILLQLQLLLLLLPLLGPIPRQGLMLLLFLMWLSTVASALLSRLTESEYHIHTYIHACIHTTAAVSAAAVAVTAINNKLLYNHFNTIHNNNDTDNNNSNNK